MKEEEIIQKIKKSDRTEYLLRRNIIERKTSTGLFLYTCLLAVIVVAVLFLFILEFQQSFGVDTALDFMHKTKYIGRVLGAVMTFGLFYDLYRLYNRGTLLNELNKEFGVE